MKNKNLLIKRILWALSIPIVLFSALILTIYLKQDEVIQSQLNTMNEGHEGLLEIGDTHLALFDNFPNISFKIDDVKVYETKNNKEKAILNVADIFIRFNLLDLISGNYDIHSLLIEEGFFNIVIHKDGSTNLQHALATTKTEDKNNPLEIHLKTIELINLDIHKYDEATKVDVETFMYFANGGFKSGDGLISGHIDSDFELNIFNNGDTTYIHDKHFEFHTDITLNEKTGIVEFKPSGVTMEHGDFELQGSLDIKNDMDLDIEIKGTKPNFDMFIAFAPHELIPVL